MYRKIQGIKQTGRLIGPVSTLFVVLVISFALFNLLDTKFTASLIKDYVLLALITLAISVLTAVLYNYFLYEFLYRLYNKIQLKSRNIFRFVVRAFVILVILQVGMIAFGFLWENRETTIDYKKITSKTQKDINVILIVIDAVRSDHLGCYGYQRRTSPNIDAFAKEGTLFKNCYTQASWTKPSTASMFTSLYPTMHGTTLHRDVLPDQLTTIAEIMQQEGYITYGYVVNPNIKSIFNYDQGFDFFDDYLIRDKMYYAALRNLPYYKDFIKKITGKYFTWADRDNIKLADRRIIPWLERYKDENFFMYLHYMDPHFPYSPPRPYRDMYPYIKGDQISTDISLYDGEIRFADEYIKKLLEKLKALRIYDKTLIVITSDHGEAFGEHNDFLHGKTIYQEQLRVPLIMKYTDIIPAGRVVGVPVRSLDILPTILDILNISCDVQLEGSSLLSLLKDEIETDFCENIFIEENLYKKYIFKGIITRHKWKYIFTEKSELRDIEKLGNEEIYDLENDPKELNNLVKQRPEILRIMRDRLDSFKKYCEKRKMTASQIELDQQTIQQLRSLGYMQ